MKYSNSEFVHRLYKRFALGKVQKKLSLFDLKKEGYSSLKNPVFVLSTGRCRTHWFTNLLSSQNKVLLQHDPEISFLEEGKLIYDHFSKSESFEPFISQLIHTARDQIWLDCAKRNLRYIETNNRITFAFPFVKRSLKNSQFLHLTRHPIDFIISGRNRNWYEGNGHDLARITHYDDKKWNNFTLNQKIGWLWLATNKFILKHKNDLDSDRYHWKRSEDLDKKNVIEIIDYLNLNPKKINNKWFKSITNEQRNSLMLSKHEIITDLKEADYFKELQFLSDQFGYYL